MRRVIAVVVVALFAASVAYSAPGAQALIATAFIDPQLEDALAAAGSDDEIEVAIVLPGVPTAEHLGLLAATGASIGGFSRLPMAAASGTKSEISAIAALSLVRSVWLNVAVEESLDQSTAQLQARDAWEEPRPAGEPTGYTGRGVTVATIDSGIDGLHPGVRYPEVTVQNVRPTGFKDAVWGPPVEDLAVTDVTSGHGSHVAGIIAGRGNASGAYRGVAPGASLIGLGASDGAEMLTILQSYDWIFANKDRYGIRVINNSWAHSNPQVPYLSGNPLDEASRMAVQEHGLVVVFAAGNAGQASGDVFNNYARNDWVVSVGGLDKKGNLAAFSSRGNDAHHANVMAPGHFIASVRASVGAISQTNATPFDLTEPTAPRMVPVEEWPYYTVKSGTSMAAPHVAGVVALMLEANPSLTPAEVRNILIDTAHAVPACELRDCGAGLVNALAAVRAALALGANEAPTAMLSVTPASGEAPLEVTLDASGSTDPDGSVTAYRWDFDGDAAADLETTTPVVSHTYAAGTHRPAVTVVDDGGLQSVAVSTEVRASQPPVASATAPARAKGGQAVTFDASASYDPDGSIVTYEWNFGDGSPVVRTTESVVTHTYAVTRAHVFGWSVTVIDDAGVSDATGAAIRITP